MNHTTLRGKRTYGFNSEEELIQNIEDYKGILVSVNAEKVMNPDPLIKNIINNNFGFTDGIGAAMALRSKGISTVKIPGAWLWLSIIKKFEGKKKFYILGGHPDVLKKTMAMLAADYPKAEFIGHHDGYLKDDDEEKILQEIKSKGADVVFVAMGTPKQEILMNKFLQKHPAIYMGLGGSYDVYCGLKKRVPPAWDRLGLEWFFRLLTEPTRITRQIVLVKFLVLMIFKRL